LTRTQRDRQSTKPNPTGVSARSDLPALRLRIITLPRSMRTSAWLFVAGADAMG
jgi:hypothetical protein